MCRRSFAAVVEHRVGQRDSRLGRGAAACSRPFPSPERHGCCAFLVRRRPPNCAPGPHAGTASIHLPVTIERRRIYILPTRFGLMLAALLFAMLIAGLNYNSNLGLAFAFLMVSLVLVAMHHCHRNLLGLGVDLQRRGRRLRRRGMRRSTSCCATIGRGSQRYRSALRPRTPKPSRASVRRVTPRSGSTFRSARRGVIRMEPVRAAYALSVRLVSRLDLRASLSYGIRRAGAERRAGRCPRRPQRRAALAAPRPAAMRSSRASVPMRLACP